jgi:hypothetical protein
MTFVYIAANIVFFYNKSCLLYYIIDRSIDIPHWFREHFLLVPMCKLLLGKYDEEVLNYVRKLRKSGK